MGKENFASMTEGAIRERVVQEAIKKLGVKEGGVEHKKIVDIYNSQCKLPRGYKLQYSDAWCAAFISYVGIVLGISDVILPEVGCGAMLSLYKKAGRFEERDDYVPQIADIVMYDWDAKAGECVGEPDHVGMIVSVSADKKTFRVIEGNYDNQVRYRDVCREYVKFRGFCLPDYGRLVHFFDDVPSSAWYADDVNRAAELGIMKGVGNGLFEPGRAPTRAELAAALVRLYDELKG